METGFFFLPVNLSCVPLLREMEKQRVVAMARMEGLLSSVLDRVVKEERREHSRQLRAEGIARGAGMLFVICVLFVIL
jgi:hypothetical protein